MNTAIALSAILIAQHLSKKKPSEEKIMVKNSRNAVITVDDTPAIEICGQIIGNAERKVLCLTNTSTAGGQRITLAFGNTTAVEGQGVVLYPGGSWSETRDAAFIPTQEAISAIASAAGGTLAIHERIGLL